MQKPPRLEFKNVGAAVLDVATLEYKGAPVAAATFHEEDGVGIGEAYVAVTGTRDEVGDIIEHGAFDRTLKTLRPKMCLGHDWNRPIGEPVEIRFLPPGDPDLPAEDASGNPWPEEAGALYTKNRYMLDTEDGRNAYAHAKFFGNRTAYSIGYVVKKHRMGRDSKGRRTRFIEDLDLYEYGPVLHGAHPMAGQRSIKSGQPGGLEVKVRRVKDSSYWGYPVGTPIQSWMKPKGRAALNMRKQGKVPSKEAGTTDAATVPGGGKRGPRSRQAEADAAGLFPEVEAPEGLRVRAVKPKGRADEHLQVILDNFADRTYGTRDPDEMVDFDSNEDDTNPLDGLLNEAITPTELEEDLRDVDWGSGRNSQDPAEVEPFIDEVVANYRARYAKRAREQAAEEQSGGGEAASGTQPAAPTGPEAAETGAETVSAAQSEPDKTSRAMWKADPARSAERLPEAARAEFEALTPEQQQAYAARRVAGDDHAAALAEPAASTDANPEGGRSLSSELATQIHDAINSAPESEHLGNRLSDGALPGPAGIAMRATATMLHLGQAKKKRVDPEQGGARTLRANPGQAAEIADAFEAVAEALEVLGKGNEGDRGDGYGGISEYLRNYAAGARNALKAEGGEAAGNAAEFDPKTTANRLATKPDTDLSEFDADQLAAIDAEFASRAEQLGKLGEITPAHQRVRDALAEAQAKPAGEPGDGEQRPPEEQPSAGEAEPVEEPPAEEEMVAADFSDDELLWHTDRDAAAQAQLSDEEQAEFEALDEAGAESYARSRMMGAPHDVSLDAARAASQRAAEVGPGTGEEERPPEESPAPEAGAAPPVTDPDVPSETAPGLEVPAPDASELAIAGEEVTPGGETVETPGQQPGQISETEQARTALSPEAAASLAAEGNADAADAADASYGVVEADDGEFEVDEDVAQRQERVASLLLREDAGNLDLTSTTDDQLRTTRGDLVEELKLQTYLGTRRTAERPSPSRDADSDAAAEPIEDGEAAAAEDAPAEPRRRPGVAGAAEDLADALEVGDETTVVPARARLEASLRRAKSDSDAVGSLRTLVESGQDITPETLRAAAEAIRAEVRAKRNEQSRARRRARRFERDRLKSLLGSVDAEMRRRSLPFDPLPGDSEASPGVDSDAGVWRDSTPDFARDVGQVGSAYDVRGSGYTAQIWRKGDNDWRFRWSTVGDDGTTQITGGSGTTIDAGAARAAVAVALDMQRTLGNIPVDSVLPTLGGTGAEARTAAERASADAIRARVTDPSVNPLTGKPNPLTPPVPLPEFDGAPMFTTAEQVRVHFEGLEHPPRDIQWDDVKLTPGGTAMVVTLGRTPYIVHTGTGLTMPVRTSGRQVPKLGKGDLYRLATWMETMPDAQGNRMDLGTTDSTTARESFLLWKDAEGQSFFDVGVNMLAMEKIRAGKWSDSLVRNFGLEEQYTYGTNPSRADYIRNLARSLDTLLRGAPTTAAQEDKKTLAITNGASMLARAGAPDAAAVVLRRRAAELRERASMATARGEQARERDRAVGRGGALGSVDPAGSAEARAFGSAEPRGAVLLEDMATAYLSLHSPRPSPGSRLPQVQPGERIAVGDGDAVRTYRVLTPMRRDASGRQGLEAASARLLDESTGQELSLDITGGGHTQRVVEIADDDRRRLHSSALGSAAFVVLDPGEPAPADPAGLKAAALGDVDAIPAEALDRAAEELPESQPERAARRAAAPEGGRPPRRGSSAAPARTAPTPPAATTPEEQTLALAQTETRANWLNTSVGLAESSLPGGFTDFDEVVANAKELAAQYPAYRDENSTSAIAAYLGDADRPGSSTPESGGRLSPGGTLTQKKDGTIEHARTGKVVWRPEETPSPALAARILDYFERASFDGEQIEWGGSGERAVTSVRGIHKRIGVNPLAAIAATAYADHLALTSRPTTTDVSAFAETVSGMDHAKSTPNPDVLHAALRPGKAEAAYTLLSGRRNAYTVGASTDEDMPGPSSTKAGTTLARRVATELEVSRSLAKTSPLDAVRRLRQVAAELDGRTIEDRDGKTYIPRDDLTVQADRISEAYNPEKISPMGLLARNNYTATIEPDLSKAMVQVETGMGSYNNATQGNRNVRLAKLKAELREAGTFKIERGESDRLRVTIGGRVVQDAPGAQGDWVRALGDGSLEIAWAEKLFDGNARPRIVLPPGGWKLAEQEKPPVPGGLTDSDYDKRTALIEDTLNQALADGQATDVAHTFGGDGQSWKPERARLHNEIVEQLWAQAASVPRDGRAVLAGGLGGAGKSTVLKGYAGVDATQYFTLNPDDIKELMAERDMIPKLEGLSPMEASALVHEESSHITSMLARRAYGEQVNVVWDITMSRQGSVEKRIAQMRKAGYTQVDAVFVDIPVEVSVERALGRHRRGLQKFASGDGFGGRYVPPALIRANSSDTSSSANRDNFDAIRDQFDSWVVYDNSVTGREPQKVSGTGTWA